MDVVVIDTTAMMQLIAKLQHELAVVTPFAVIGCIVSVLTVFVLTFLWVLWYKDGGKKHG